jgi:hypothetical protein
MFDISVPRIDTSVHQKTNRSSYTSVRQEIHRLFNTLVREKIHHSFDRIVEHQSVDALLLGRVAAARIELLQHQMLLQKKLSSPVSKVPPDFKAVDADIDKYCEVLVLNILQRC